MRSGARVEMAVEKRTDPLNATEVRLRSGTSVWGACSDDVNGQASPDRHVHGRIELAIPVPTNLGDPGIPELAEVRRPVVGEDVVAGRLGKHRPHWGVERGRRLLDLRPGSGRFRSTTATR